MGLRDLARAYTDVRRIERRFGVTTAQATDLQSWRLRFAALGVSSSEFDRLVRLCISDSQDVTGTNDGALQLVRTAYELAATGGVVLPYEERPEEYRRGK